MSKPAPIHPAPQPPSSRLWNTLKALVRARITAGIVVVVPIIVTFYIVRFVFQITRDTSQWVVYGVLHGDWARLLPPEWRPQWQFWTAADLTDWRITWAIGILSFFVTLLMLYAIGLLTANIFGKRILQGVDVLFDRVPLVKTIYRASKQILVTFAGDDNASFQRVALIPFPNSSVRSIGFITGFSREKETGEELVSVFIATTPNPTSGFVFILRRSEVTELDWTVEDGIRVIMSGGILVPPTMNGTLGPAPTADEAAAPRTPRGSAAGAAK